MTARVAILRRLAACLALAALAAAPGAAQDAAPTYPDWRLFEAGEDTAAYRAKLREGGFDAAAQAFLVQQALPQLALKRNRTTIDRVRRRMREVLCGDGGSNPAAAESARKVIAESMTALARSAEAAQRSTRLIQESNARAIKGMELTDDTARALEAIVQGAAQVSQLVDEIASASSQQASSASQS